MLFSARKRKGYTLIEIVVAAGIIAILSAQMILDLRGIGKAQRLQAAGNEMASRIKQAQGLAYSNTKQMICSTGNLVCRSGSACDAGYPTGCVNQYVSRYGVRFDTDGTQTKYMIGADYSDYVNFVAGEAIPGGVVTLPKGITISSVSPAQVAGAYDLNYIYDSANASPFVACAPSCANTTITLKDASVTPNLTKTVVIQKMTGLVSVQ